MELLGGVLPREGDLPARDREIAVLRTAWRTGCRYVGGQHVLIGRRAGLTDNEITALTGSDPEGDRDATSRTAVVVRLVDEMVELDDVTDRRWDALEGYTVEQTLELTVLVDLYYMAAGFLNAAGVEPEELVSAWSADLASWPGPR